MEQIALWPNEQREALFKETGARRNLLPAIIEKDFWVCWVLGRLFSAKPLNKKLLFKGGTSLSKVFKLIERFSEDIDLILDWNEVTEENPLAERSKTGQDKFNKKIQKAALVYISESLLPEIQKILGSVCQIAGEKESPDVISIQYPSDFSDTYLRPEVRLEIGPLAQWIPNDNYEIHPYAAEEFPHLFEQPSSFVQVIKAERTFWEKATILHQEAHRPENKPQPIRYSRHYYDTARMARSKVRKTALSNIELLSSVVNFKKKFYPQRWAKYDLAVPGTFKLIPPAHALTTLEKDYRAMEEMIYGEIPTLDEIMGVLKELEDEINML